MSKSIDKKLLYQELLEATHQDKLYWLRNDAKIKSCYTASSYEEFRQNVAAAHLIPLDKGDKSKKHVASWNKITEM